MAKMNKGVPILIALILLLFSSVSFAAIQTIEADGSYQMGEKDSIVSAKESAKNDALRHAAEQVGVYVRSYSKSKDYYLTDDEIEVVAANVMKVKKCDYTQEYINNTLVFNAHVVVTVDDSKFDSIIKQEKRNLKLKEELEQEKERNKDIKNLQIQHGVTDIPTETELLLNTVLISKAEYTKALFNLSGMIKTRNGVVPARAYYLRSIVYFDMERYNEALSDISRAITIDAGNAAKPADGSGESTVHTSFFRKELLDGMPAVSETEYIRHVRLPKPLRILMDGKKQLGVVILDNTPA